MSEVVAFTGCADRSPLEHISVNSEMRASENSEVPKPDAFTPVLNGILVSIK